MQSYVMMALGAYRFAIDTGGFEKFQRSTSWRWPSQERIGVAPARSPVHFGAAIEALQK